MTMKWLNKLFASNLVKSLIVLLAMGLIASLAIESKLQRVSAQTNPEKFLTDLNGQPRSVFNTGESGYLTLRGYAQALPGSSKLADVMLILDATGSMGAGAGSKCESAKTAAISFVDRVPTANLTQVGLTTITTGVVKNYPLTLMDTDVAKTTLKTFIGTITCAGNTPIGEAVQRANSELKDDGSGHGRITALKYIALLSDGEENSGTPLVKNGGVDYFSNSVRANDYPIDALSPLGEGYNPNPIENVNYFTIFYGTGDDCTTGCPLMRFAAARSNQISLGSGFTWYDSYNFENSLGATNGVDSTYFFKVATADEILKIYNSIVDLIEESSASINFYEKLASGVQYNKLVSVKDKGGRVYSPSKVEILSDGTYKFTLLKIPDSYACDVGETVCQNASTAGTITGNFVDLSLQVTFSQTGKFDLDSNYSGCETGHPRQTASSSKLEYIDPRTNTVLNNFAMPAMCLSVVDSGAGILISKSTLLLDLKTQTLLPSASFEVGDEVVIRISINETLPFRQTWKIKDTIPPSVGKLTGNPVLQTPGSGNNVELTSSIDGDTVVIQNKAGDQNTSLLGGVNIIEYRYKI